MASLDKIDFTDTYEVAEAFLDIVKDNQIRRFLFDTKASADKITAENLSERLDGAQITYVMRRIINIAYLIALSRWKQIDSNKLEFELDDEEDLNSFNNARFTKLFQSAIISEEITLDLQIFSLIELWLGLKSSTTLVRGLFNNIYDPSKTDYAIGRTLQKARDFIKNPEPLVKDQGPEVWEKVNKTCYDLLCSFIVLRAVKISYSEEMENDNDFVIRYPLRIDKEVVLYPNKYYENYRIVATSKQIQKLQKDGKNDDENRLYMLTQSIEFDRKLQSVYRSFDDTKEARVETEICSNDTFNEGNEVYKDEVREIRKFLSFSYKNLRDFAFVISDAIKNNIEKKQQLLSVYQKKSKKDISERIALLSKDDVENIYWDNTIMLMLVEMGVSDFLEQILDDETIFNIILDNIGLRIIGRNKMRELKNDYKNRLKKIQDSNDREYRKKERVLALRVDIIISSMPVNPIEQSIVEPAFTESLMHKYDKIKNYIQIISDCIPDDSPQKKNKQKDNYTLDDLANATENLLETFEDIFVFLHIFYVGLNEYAITKINQEKEKKQDKDEENKSDPRVERNNAFIEAVKNDIKELKNEITSGQTSNKISADRVTKVFEKFCELCTQYNSYSFKEATSISKAAKNLKYLITRNYICDAEKLRYFVRSEVIKPQKEWKNKNVEEKYTIFEMLEKDLRFMREHADNYRKSLNYFKDLFMFLVYNEDYNEKGLYAKVTGFQDKDCDPIYPYLVNYYSESVDKDRLKKCTYRVPIPQLSANVSDEDEMGMEVTLLTEDVYPPNTYFCIPLRYGSSDSWWINPFLIEASLFNQIEYKNNGKDKNKQ